MRIKHCPVCAAEMINTEVCENCLQVEAKGKKPASFFTAQRIAWALLAIGVLLLVQSLKTPTENPPALMVKPETPERVTQIKDSSRVVGRWCDEMTPAMPSMNSVLAIVLTRDGIYLMQAEFGDGSSAQYRLEQRSGSIFEKTGSSFGDKYRITKSTGNLQLLDNDGPIRTAKRLDNTPISAEC